MKNTIYTYENNLKNNSKKNSNFIEMEIHGALHSR